MKRPVVSGRQPARPRPTISKRSASIPRPPRGAPSRKQAPTHHDDAHGTDDVETEGFQPLSDAHVRDTASPTLFPQQQQQPSLTHINTSANGVGASLQSSHDISNPVLFSGGLHLDRIETTHVDDVARGVDHHAPVESPRRRSFHKLLRHDDGDATTHRLLHDGDSNYYMKPNTNDENGDDDASSSSGPSIIMSTEVGTNQQLRRGAQPNKDDDSTNSQVGMDPDLFEDSEPNNKKKKKNEDAHRADLHPPPELQVPPSDSPTSAVIRLSPIDSAKNSVSSFPSHIAALHHQQQQQQHHQHTSYTHHRDNPLTRDGGNVQQIIHFLQRLRQDANNGRRRGDATGGDDEDGQRLMQEIRRMMRDDPHRAPHRGSGDDDLVDVLRFLQRLHDDAYFGAPQHGGGLQSASPRLFSDEDDDAAQIFRFVCQMMHDDEKRGLYSSTSTSPNGSSRASYAAPAASAAPSPQQNGTDESAFLIAYLTALMEDYEGGGPRKSTSRPSPRSSPAAAHHLPPMHPAPATSSAPPQPSPATTPSQPFLPPMYGGWPMPVIQSPPPIINISPPMPYPYPAYSFPPPQPMMYAQQPPFQPPQPYQQQQQPQPPSSSWTAAPPTNYTAPTSAATNSEFPPPLANSQPPTSPHGDGADRHHHSARRRSSAASLPSGMSATSEAPPPRTRAELLAAYKSVMPPTTPRPKFKYRTRPDPRTSTRGRMDFLVDNRRGYTWQHATPTPGLDAAKARMWA